MPPIELEGGTDGGGTPLSTWTGTPFSCFQTYNSRLLANQVKQVCIIMSFPTLSEDDYIIAVSCAGQCNFHNHTKGLISQQEDRPCSDRPGYGLSNDSGDPPGSHLPRMIVRNAEFRSHSEERRNKHAAQATNYYYI